LIRSDKEAAFDSMGREAERSLALEAIKSEELKVIEKTGQTVRATFVDWTPVIGSPSVRTTR
jgi:hypothetical protein